MLAGEYASPETMIGEVQAAPQEAIRSGRLKLASNKSADAVIAGLLLH